MKQVIQKILLIVFGLCIALIIVETGLRIAGFAYLYIQKYKNRIDLDKEGVYRILCLGESTTARQYPGYLEEILNREGNGRKFKVIDAGIPGINSAVILFKLKENLAVYRPHMVIVMMGINDPIAAAQNHFYYEEKEGFEEEPFLAHFRVHKLIGLLLLHSRAKLSEFSHRNFKITANNGNVYSQSESDYIEAGEKYLLQKDFRRAKECFRAVLAINPTNDLAYARLGLCYRWTNRLKEAEEFYREALRINPDNWIACIGLADVYDLRVENCDESEKLIKKAIALAPDNEWVYLQYGDHCTKYGIFTDEVEAAYKKAIMINPMDLMAYLKLGNFYFCSGRFAEAEAILKNCLSFGKHNKPLEEVKGEGQADDRLNALRALGHVYWMQGRYKEAIATLEDCYGIDPNDELTLRILKVYYHRLGNLEKEKEYEMKLSCISADNFSRRTKENYRKLCEEALSRGIKLICMQYPFRKIDDLKNNLSGIKGIVFLENKNIFEKALKNASYGDYFRDKFAGDFGHCTERGNRLLARNIGDTIFKIIEQK